MITSIRVEMLGGLAVWADDEPVLDASAKINKPWQVFCFLVLNRNAPSTAARLVSVLWPDENLNDPVNVLKSTVYALRKEFKAAQGTKESPVLYENGGYICNPAIAFEVDVELFEAHCKRADEVDDTERMRRLSAAVALYKGGLLPQLESEVWVMPLALYYRQLYGTAVQQVCRRLQEEERYNELLATATAANRVDPLEESFYTYMFRALYELQMHRAIIPAYHKTARIFAEELGASLCQEIQDIYAAASEEVDTIEQDIMIIKDELREVAGENGNVAGPLYCTYDVFKYLYQMVARSAERGGGSVMIVLLTLVSEDGDVLPAKVMSGAMGQLKKQMMSGLLRKSDTVARYSKSQYIIMLSMDRPQSALNVIARVQKRCQGFLGASGIKMVFANTEMEPLGQPATAK